MAGQTLRVTAGPAAGTSVPINGGEVLLGRKVTGLGRLDGDRQVSARHARVAADRAGGLVIEDLQSSNGTFVNGMLLSEPRALRLGDVVQIGQTEMRVVLDGSGDGGPRADPQPPASHTAAPGASLLYGGQRVPLDDDDVTVGRADTNTIVLGNGLVSRRHALFGRDRDGYYVRDLGSRNGTYLNGEQLRDDTRRLRPGDSLTIGSEPIRFLAGEATRSVSSPQVPLRGTQVVRLERERLRIGRDPANDVVLSDPNVSRFHAEVLESDGVRYLRDLGSRNGTRVDGQPVSEARLRIGSEIGVGPFRLIFDGADFLARDDRGTMRLAAEDVTVEVRGKRILDRASLDVQPGEFVALIGESGSGKTTLIKALAGVTHPSAGGVRVNGEPVTARLSEIGYVPQDEIVHSYLTVREALTYAARLRLPQDSSEKEIAAAVEAVLTELALTEHAETRVGSLSGGQRKRVGVGVELVNRPGLLFLDEATTGLDPALETRLMQLMRDLANNRRAVVTITHATKNLGLCDKVAVMGRGGHLCFFGAPTEAVSFFGVQQFDQIYGALERIPTQQWRERWLARSAETPQHTTISDPSDSPQRFARPRSGRTIARQSAVLASRYLKLTLRDRRNMLILLGQVPILALLVSILFKVHVFGNQPGQVQSATELVFLLVTLAIWLGSISAAREIIKERPVYTREHAVGVRIPAYLLSKLSVLFALSTVQTAGLCALVFLLRPLHERSAHYAVVIALLVLTSWVSVGMGLLLSSLVNTENQATSFLPLILVPQLLFAGQLKPLHQLPTGIQAVADAVYSRWAFAGVGSVLDFNHRFTLDPREGALEARDFGHAFFSPRPGVAAGVLALFLAVFALGTVLGLRRHTE